MSLNAKIAEEMKAAMKSGSKLRLETLRTLKAALTEKEIERRGAGAPMTPADELGVMTSAAKKRKESIELFAKGGRTDLVAQEEAELAIIQEFLPKQMTAGEIEALVRATAAALGATGAADFNKVMPAVMKEAKGKADGKLVQETVKRVLGVPG